MPRRGDTTTCFPANRRAGTCSWQRVREWQRLWRGTPDGIANRDEVAADVAFVVASVFACESDPRPRACPAFCQSVGTVGNGMLLIRWYIDGWRFACSSESLSIQ